MLNWPELEADEVLRCAQRGLAGEAGFLPSGFLDTHQWLGLLELSGIAINGGFPLAQFRVAHADAASAPLQFATIDPASLPVNARTVSGLRTLLRASTFPDAAVGDIYLDDRFVLAVLSSQSLESVGLDVDYSDVAPTLALREERLTAASLRADAVISAAFRVSRAEAQKAIQYGFVYSNFQPVLKRSQELAVGARLVYRTKGSLELADAGINPRSGRSWLSVRRLTQ